MAKVIFSSGGERDLLEGEEKEHPYAIELSSDDIVLRIYVGKGGRHPILKKKVADWCMDKNNVKGSWYCEYVRTTPTTGYSVIRFKNQLDAVMFRLVF